MMDSTADPLPYRTRFGNWLKDRDTPFTVRQARQGAGGSLAQCRQAVRRAVEEGVLEFAGEVRANLGLLCRTAHAYRKVIAAKRRVG